MIVAIIPAFNEEYTIGSIVLKTKKHVDKVIVVDDGSKDKTAMVAKLAGADVIQHVQNGGKGSALKTGFEFARKLDPDVIVCLDADAQHNPADIPKVTAPIINGEAEMVIASRYLNKEHKKNIPRYRRFGLWVLTSTLNLGSNCKITDTQSGFRAYSKGTFNKFRFHQNGLNVESEMLEDAIDNNFKIKEVPISIRYEGLDTSSEKPGKHGLGVLSYVLGAIKERHPLLFFGVSGAILLLVGLAFAVYCIDCYFKYDSLPFGPSLLASVLILMGALCLFSGLILNSISSMIQGQTRSALVRQEMLAKDIDEKMIQRQTPLSLFQGRTLVNDIDERMIQRQTPLSLHQRGIMAKEFNENKINGLTPLNPTPQRLHLEDPNENNGPIPLSLLQQEILLGDIDEKNIQMTVSTSIMNNNGPRNHTRNALKYGQDISDDMSV